MIQFQDLIAKETRKIVDVGTDIAKFDGFDDTLETFEDETRRAFEEILGNLAAVPARYSRTIEVVEKIVVSDMRQIIEIITDWHLSDLPAEHHQAIKQMEDIISDFLNNADSVTECLFSDWEHRDLRRIRRILGTPAEDGIPPCGLYKLNEEAPTIVSISKVRWAWREAVRHEHRRMEKNLPQNPEWRNQIYQALTDDMFDAAEAAAPARVREFQRLREDYTRAMGMFERKFTKEFVEEIIARAENHPLLVEENQRKQRAKQHAARKRQRVESAIGLNNLLLPWLVTSIFVSVFVLNRLAIDKNFVFVGIALVFSTIIFFPVLLVHKLLKKYQLRKFDRHHPLQTDEENTYEKEKKRIAELIADECDIASPGWVEKAGLKKAKEAKTKAERQRRTAEARGEFFGGLSAEQAEEDIRSAERAVETERRNREAIAKQAKQNAEWEREEQRYTTATGLDKIVADLLSPKGIINFLLLVLLGCVIARWLNPHDLHMFFVNCLFVLAVFGILYGRLDDLVRAYQLRRFDRDHPPPTEDID